LVGAEGGSNSLFKAYRLTIVIPVNGPGFLVVVAIIKEDFWWAIFNDVCCGLLL
jgi:hypothetical protein